MTTPSTVPSAAAEPRALRILAKSVFRELKGSGYDRSDIVAFATEMLSLVSSDMRDDTND
ncbi:MAG: hypothetical protein AB7S26_26920 [Sandaracinaceae bacterium]